MTTRRARRYQRGSICKSENGEIWYGKYYPAPGAPQKYENADWRKATGQEAEYLFRRSILPEIGELRCRDLKAEHLRAVLRKLAGTGLSYESVSKVRFAMGDMVKRMLAKEYLSRTERSELSGRGTRATLTQPKQMRFARLA